MHALHGVFNGKKSYTFFEIVKFGKSRRGEVAGKILGGILCIVMAMVELDWLGDYALVSESMSTIFLFTMFPSIDAISD